jgi:hypothetical protein
MDATPEDVAKKTRREPTRRRGQVRVKMGWVVRAARCEPLEALTDPAYHSRGAFAGATSRLHQMDSASVIGGCILRCPYEERRARWRLSAPRSPTHWIARPMAFSHSVR